MSLLQFEKHEMLLSIIKALSNAEGEADSIKEIIHNIKNYTGINAVAIRIKKNSDFPYYSTEGFSPEFIDSECFLLAKNCINCHSGNVKNDIPLECICGMILSGKSDHDLSCFTQNGSFWINSSKELPASGFLDQPDRKFRLRCIKDGYNSILLIPVRAEKELIGLIQINDRRTGLLDKNDVTFFESLCDALGPAIRMKGIESAMYETNRNLETIIEERTIELLRTIKDKDRLLDEVNHRIKNNLLIISSLLNLQVMKESNQYIREALNGALIRINSMGLIHQKLYSSNDLNNIDIENYILTLYNRIMLTYRIPEENAEFSLKCRGIAVNIDTAIPCGLIINEIISNSVKHAIIPGKKLVISIAIIQDENTFNISISDNGPGLKSGFCINRDSKLGMELIKALIKQLDGTLDIYNNNGLTVELRIFKENKEENRWNQKKS